MRFLLLALLTLAAWRLLRRRDSIADQQWRRAMADPGFRSAVRDGLREARAGRTRPWVEPYMDMEWQPQ